MYVCTLHIIRNHCTKAQLKLPNPQPCTRPPSSSQLSSLYCSPSPSQPVCTFTHYAPLYSHRRRHAITPLSASIPHLCIYRSLNLLYLAPTLFCKCTCFSNSTIIPLNAPRASSHQQMSLLLLHTRNQDDGNRDGGSGGGGGGDEGKKGNEDRKEFRAGNCGDCNRQYCIDAHLPICKDVTVGDVVATCFRTPPSFLFYHQPTYTSPPPHPPLFPLRCY